MALATPQAVRAEGSFRREQFNKATDGEFETLVGERIAEASAELATRVGAVRYGTTDLTVRAILTTAEIYLATAKLLQTIESIVSTWDSEVLPAEFVDSRELTALIARYRGQVDDLLGPYELGVRGGPHPYLGARAIEDS
jgi:hypothetical protein